LGDFQEHQCLLANIVHISLKSILQQTAYGQSAVFFNSLS